MAIRPQSVQPKRTATPAVSCCGSVTASAGSNEVQAAQSQVAVGSDAEGFEKHGAHRPLTHAGDAAQVEQSQRSETDFTEDLKKIDVPTFIMHGDDDQIVPIGASGLMSAKLVQKPTLKVYAGFCHGMCTTNTDQINADLLAFIKE